MKVPLAPRTFLPFGRDLRWASLEGGLAVVCAETVGWPITLRVKVADLADNTDLPILPLLDPGRARIELRYAKARHDLGNL